MDFMPIVPFLATSFPESLVLYYMIFFLASKKVSFHTIAILAIVTSLASYGIRSLPMEFGVHFLLQAAVMIFLVILFIKLYWQTAVIVVLLAGIALGLAEGAILPILAWIFSLELGEIIADPLLRTIFTLPHLFFLASLTYIANKKQWRIPLAKKNPLFIICLVQVLMLVLLIAVFHAYNSGVYPSFTFSDLINTSIIVILVSVVATIFVAVYLLKAVEKEAKLEMELHYAREINKLNLELEEGRHDFYNYIIAMHKYMEDKDYDRLQKYIEKHYKNIVDIKSLVDIKFPEVSSLISVKYKEALKKSIEFKWRVDANRETLPLSSEDLTRLLGNLLDNALEAAVAKGGDDPKRIDLDFKCNQMGLMIRITNTGNPIPEEIKNDVFVAGYTTKDKSKHSGLGLHIINETVQRLDGQLELKEAEDYQGVQFIIHIPWKE